MIVLSTAPDRLGPFHKANGKTTSVDIRAGPLAQLVPSWEHAAEHRLAAMWPFTAAALGPGI